MDDGSASAVARKVKVPEKDISGESSETAAMPQDEKQPGGGEAKTTPEASAIVEERTVSNNNVAGDAEDSVPSVPASRQPLVIDLLRHGEVATPCLFSAPVDEPLGMEGWKQLTIATQNGYWDTIITPPTRRCHDFARLLSQRLDAQFVVDVRYAELDFGEWIGLSQEEILARDPELLQQYYFQPRRFYAPGGESMSEFSMRVHAAWDDLLVNHAGQRVLILTQAAVIRTLIAKALGLLYQKALRFEIDYAHFSRLKVYPDGEVVLTGHGLPVVSG
ncbi:MAG: histidine phosphatase family protein [Thiolinea sp.]